MAGGAAALRTIAPITIAIVVLLAILAFSYWQTVAAYPSNGGSYLVALRRHDLGGTVCRSIISAPSIAADTADMALSAAVL